MSSVPFFPALTERQWRARTAAVVVVPYVLYFAAFSPDGASGTVVTAAQLAVSSLCLLLPGYLLTSLLFDRTDGTAVRVLLPVPFAVVTVYFVTLLLHGVWAVGAIAQPVTRANLVLALGSTSLVLAAAHSSRVPLRRPANLPRLDPRDVKLVVVVLSVLVAVVAGVHRADVAGDNGLALLALAALGVTPGVVAYFYRDSWVLPVTIFLVSVGLTLHNAIVSPFVQGRDIHKEFYFANRVLIESQWQVDVSHSFNSLLSVVSLIPTVTRLLPVDLATALKVAFPILFALLPVFIYYVVRNQFDRGTAYVSAYLFAFLSPFYFDMLTMVRQQMAMLLAAAILLVAFSGGESHSTRRRVAVVLLFVGLVVSHYATSYLFVCFFVGGKIVQYLLGRLGPHFGTSLGTDRSGLSLVSAVTLTLALVVWAGWYMNTSDSVFFNNFSVLLYGVTVGIIDVLLQSASSKASRVIGGSSVSLYYDVTKAMYLGVMLSIGLGVVVSGLRFLSGKVERIHRTGYFSLSVVIVGFLVLNLVLPYFSFELTRLLLITMIVVAPFAVYFFLRLGQFASANVEPRTVVAVFCVFLVPFFLFNSGVVYEVTGSFPSSPAVSENTIHDESPREKYNFYNYYTTHRADVAAAQWWNRHDASARPLYSTGTSYLPFISYGMGSWEMSTYFGDTRSSVQLREDTPLDGGSHVYASYLNTEEGIYVNKRSGREISINDYRTLRPKIERHSRVYSNGVSAMYYVAEDE